MRCYCSCLRGDWGIILLRKVISVSLLLWRSSTVSHTHTARHSSSWRWSPHRAWPQGPGDARDLLNGDAQRGSWALEFLTRSIWGSPGGSDSKESACNAGDLGFFPALGRSPRDGRKRKWQPTPVSLPGESHGQRSLAGSSPWSCRVIHD